MPTPDPAATVLLSRREALLAAALASTAVACESGSAPARVAAEHAPPSGEPQALEALTSGRMRDDERGGSLVLLLHGWGARGDDLLPLAQALARPRARFVLPAGPLRAGPEGRAWWSLEERRPAHAWTEELEPGHMPHAQVTSARARVTALLRASIDRYGPERVAVAGFSQGAMLALDVALSMPTVERVAALSGALLADSLPALRASRPARLRAFVAHGRQDGVVSFTGAEHSRDILRRHGVQVTWHAFDGGHGIPPAVVAELERFLFPA